MSGATPSPGGNMPRTDPVLLAAVLSCASLLTGCTTATKYQSSEVHSPPIALRIAKSEAPVEVMIHTVIVYQGPGSWKQRALWDEYLVSISNTGSSPLQIDEVSLSSVLGQAIHPGDDPWTLETTSIDNWKHYRESGLNLAMGTLGMGASLTLAGVESMWTAVNFGSPGLVLMPVAIVGVQVTNSQNRKMIEREFAARRLEIPVTLESGQRISGSLFFPQTPDPQALTFHSRFGSEVIRLSMDFSGTPLSKLHMATPDGD